MARRYRWRHDSLLNFLYDIVCRDQNCCSKRWSDFLWPVWPNWESPLLLFTLIWTSISIFNWMSETQTHFICYLLVFVNFFFTKDRFFTPILTFTNSSILLLPPSKFSFFSILGEFRQLQSNFHSPWMKIFGGVTLQSWPLLAFFSTSHSALVLCRCWYKYQSISIFNWWSEYQYLKRSVEYYCNIWEPPLVSCRSV